MKIFIILGFLLAFVNAVTLPTTGTTSLEEKIAVLNEKSEISKETEEAKNMFDNEESGLFKCTVAGTIGVLACVVTVCCLLTVCCRCFGVSLDGPIDGSMYARYKSTTESETCLSCLKSESKSGKKAFVVYIIIITLLSCAVILIGSKIGC